MIGIKKEIIDYLYENNVFLNYIRYNPHWYKILYYEPERFEEFLNEAKENLKITMKDKIERMQNQIEFITSLVDYIKK